MNDYELKYIGIWILVILVIIVGFFLFWRWELVKRQFDRLLLNSKFTTQERLDMMEKKQKEPLLTNKCLDCEKNLYYGKTCNGQCIKEAEE